MTEVTVSSAFTELAADEEFKADSVVNGLSGLGTGHDVSTSTRPGSTNQNFNEDELDKEYETGLFLGQIIDRPARDMTKAGWYFSVVGGDRNDPFQKEFERLEVQAKVEEAFSLARQHGS